ncbi:MAG TPA: hypothetical protein VJG90_05010 [Candidatus Nanoarchaeia archaeon]|nr:hypothetical protein [Candidatus Nanoarchaeia archaeon]
MTDQLYELETVPRILSQPSCILQDQRDQNVYTYFGRCKNKPKAFMVIVVKYLNGEGFILTGFYADQIK